MGNSLALCMIVKNEEKYLPYCLASVYKICDEIIVVDTGSTDRTVEIAEAFNAYVIHVPWKDDFSLVRNIAHVPAESDWIVWLDGDEVFSKAGCQKIKNQLLLDNSVDFYLMPRVNFWKDLKHTFAYPDSQYKIYRNNIGLEWKNKIHEKIFDESNSNHRKRLKNTDVHIFHYAYVKSPEEVKKKMGLYIHIENPEMTKSQLERHSVNHSFFQRTNPNEVQNYDGVLPEVFEEIVVNDKGIKWKDGREIITYSKDATIIVPQKKIIKKEVEEEKIEIQPGLTSVIVASYNKVEYLEPCIRGVYESTKIPFEVVVIDNGSNQDSMTEFLTNMSKKYSNFRYKQLPENVGFAKGYNTGVKIARGEWICILNNDTLVTSSWLEKMIQHLKEDPEIGLIGPVSNNIHGEHQMIIAPDGYSFGDYITLVDNINANLKTKRVYSSWVTGCVMVFHRSIIDELATVSDPPRKGVLFTEDFLTGCGEDSDLDFYIQHRLHKKLAVAKDVFIFHHGQKTLGDNPKWREIQERNDRILRQRWPEIFPNG